MNNEYGACEQLQRIAKMLGYQSAWASPGNSAKWFLQRPSETAGYITINMLDTEIASLLARAKTPDAPSSVQSSAPTDE